MADRLFPARTDSLEQIVDNIDSALKEAGLSLDRLGGIGVGLGPGSWTGIRVGVTVGKMLAFSAGMPLAGVSTLSALAYSARDRARLICSVIGVGTRDMVYAAFFRRSGETVIQSGDYFVGSLSGLSEMIKASLVMVGPQANLYVSQIREKIDTGIKIVPVETPPTGSAIAFLASERLQRGESDEVLPLTPLYLKESTARAFTGRYTGNSREVR